MRNDASPPQHCEFRMRGHYHCLRPGCYFVTNITTKLPWHVKKHEKAERRAANGFKYFTKREECGRMGKLSHKLSQNVLICFSMRPLQSITIVRTTVRGTVESLLNLLKAQVTIFGQMEGAKEVHRCSYILYIQKLSCFFLKVYPHSNRHFEIRLFIKSSDLLNQFNLF